MACTPGACVIELNYNVHDVIQLLMTASGKLILQHNAVLTKGYHRAAINTFSVNKAVDKKSKVYDNRRLLSCVY